jgi:hypothetical protein
MSLIIEMLRYQCESRQGALLAGPSSALMPINGTGPSLENGACPQTIDDGIDFGG